MEYLLKASAVILIFYTCYKLFLQRETFFELNRWFLLLGLFMAVTLPFVVIPVYMEYVPVVQQFIVAHDGITTPSTIENSLNFTQILYLVYSVGALFFLVKLGTEISSLLLILKKNTSYKKGSFSFIETHHKVPPFSFFKYIVYNKNQFNETELNHIINHEKVHAKQFHSVDIMLIHIATMVFWFNPFIWLYKKELQQNLEFIADKEAQTISNCEKSYQALLLKASVPNYQLVLANNFYNSLTRLTLFGKPIAIGKPLGQVKKRIVMLQKSKSKQLNVWRYALVLPVLGVFLMSANTKEIFVEKAVVSKQKVSMADPSVEHEITNVLNSTGKEANISKASQELKNTDAKKEQPKIVDSNKTSPKLAKTIGDHEMVVVTKDLTDADLQAIKTQLKEEGIDVKFKGIKRNGDNEITAIKIEVSSKKSNANYHTESDDPIRPINIGFDSEGGSLSIGNSGVVHGSGDHAFSYVGKDGNHKIHTTGSADNVFVIAGDDDENIVVRKVAKAHLAPKVKGKIHVILEDDVDEHKKLEEIVVHGFGDNDSIKVERLNKGKAVWMAKDEVTDIIAIENENSNKFFISNDGKEPLYILNGKEISKKEMIDLKPDVIEKIEILKGDSATEKYGEKGMNGVILVTTKDKK